jgi:hypothetical protein
MIIRINNDCLGLGDSLSSRLTSDVILGLHTTPIIVFSDKMFLKNSLYSDFEEVGCFWKIKTNYLYYYVDKDHCEVIDTDELKEPQNKYLNMLLKKLIFK